MNSSETITYTMKNKNNVTLEMLDDGSEVRFNVEFSLENELVDLKLIIGFRLFELMGKLNPDIIESTQVLNYDENNGRTLMILKPFGKEIGLARKYIYSSTSIKWNEDNSSVQIESFQQPLPITISIPGAEASESADSIMYVTFLDSHHAKITYSFSMILDSSMPRFMRKIPGNIMNKVFTRIKEFIENIGTDTKI